MPGNTEHTTNQMRNLQGLLFRPSSKNGLFKWFHKGVGLIYLCAAFPLLFQIGALIGENGLSPAHELLQKSYASQGAIASFLQFPSLFHLFPHTSVLYALVLLTCVGGLMLLAGIRPFYGALLAWGSFLSICSIGGDFFTIIIDFFLCEVGFLTLFSSYYEQRKKAVPNLVAFAFVLLNFRLWFCMGVNKFYFPQPSWTHFSFFEYFFQAQPMPTPAARWFHQLPLVFKQSAVAALFIAEIIIPFFVFGSRKFRLIAFVTFTLTSVLIQLAGNYGYFNLLSIITGVLVLNDTDVPLLRQTTADYSLEPLRMNRVARYILSYQIVLQTLYCLLAFDPNPPSPQYHFNQFFTNLNPENQILKRVIAPFKIPDYWRICIPYGLFRDIPRYHGEIRMEGSNDSLNWQAYTFRYLPSGTTDYLGFYAPYYPRLDHLFFYENVAAPNYKWNPLNQYNNQGNPWIERFIQKLLTNDRDISNLLLSNPFSGKEAPRFIRARVYRLEFDGSGKHNWKQSPMPFEKIYSLKTPCRGAVVSFEEAMKTVYGP